MPKGIVIPADEDAPLRAEAFSDFADYQRAVGGLIQPIDIDGLKVTFYVNEEVKVNGLPGNRRASLLWWGHVPSIRHADYFVGDVVLIGTPDEDGETTDLPDELMSALMSDQQWRVEVQTIDAPGQWVGNWARYGTCFDAWNAVLLMAERWLVVTETRVVPA